MHRQTDRQTGVSLIYFYTFSTALVEKSKTCLEEKGEDQGSRSVSMTKNVLFAVCNGCDRDVECPRILITWSWKSGGLLAVWDQGSEAQSATESGARRETWLHRNWRLLCVQLFFFLLESSWLLIYHPLHTNHPLWRVFPVFIHREMDEKRLKNKKSFIFVMKAVDRTL